MLTTLLDRVPFLRGLLDFIYPPICAGCGAYCETSTGVCSRCEGRIEWSVPDSPEDLGAVHPQPGDFKFPLFAAGIYSDPLQRIIIQYKFNHVTRSVALVTDKLVELFGEKIQKLAPVSLVPIPLHPSREYMRGYNQAALFARELSGRLKMPVIDTLIIRMKKRKPQSKVNQSKREANIKNVFELAEEQLESDEARKLILVDDVVTSGHTMFEARRVLVAGGYDVVGAIAMARAL